MRQWTGKSRNSSKKMNAPIEKRLPSTSLHERYYYTYDIKNISGPENNRFIIERELRVARLRPWNTKSAPDRKPIKPHKKRYNTALSPVSKKGDIL